MVYHGNDGKTGQPFFPLTELHSTPQEASHVNSSYDSHVACPQRIPVSVEGSVFLAAGLGGTGTSEKEGPSGSSSCETMDMSDLFLVFLSC